MPSSLDDYEVVGVIGSGSYGTCRKIRRKKDGKVMVWKELDYGTMSDTEKQMLVSEVNLLRELKHEHIVRYYDRIIDRSNTTLYIVMEYCEGGDLATVINRIKREGRHVEEDQVWRMCLQIASALKECHSRQKNGKAVLHRDLKPANIFLDGKGSIKLGDFGLARVLNHDTSFAQTFVGTPYYMSPEQMNYMSYNEKSDVWSLGCLLYELCALRPPFTASNQRELATRIRVGRFARLPMRYSDDLNEVIGCMLQVEERKRTTIQELLQNKLLLKHTTEKPEKRSTDSDTDVISAYESLKFLRQQLRDKELELRKKELELEKREKTIGLREKLATEKLARAEKLMKEVETQKALAVNLNTNTSDISGLSDLSLLDDLPRHSCLAKRKTVDSPKKRVSFTLDKENEVPPSSNLKTKLDFCETNEKPVFAPKALDGAVPATKLDTGGGGERQPTLDFHTKVDHARYMLELRSRLLKARQGLDPASGLSADMDYFKNRPLLGIR